MSPDPHDSLDLLQATVSLQRQILAAEDVDGLCEQALQTLLRLTESRYAHFDESDPPPGGPSAWPPGHPPISTSIEIPLSWNGKLVGGVALANRPGGYDRSLVDRLAPLLDACAALLHVRRQSAEKELREEQSRRAEQALRNLAESATPVVGAEFFHSLVRNLASSLEVDYAFVSRLDEENPPRVRTIAAFGNGAPLDNLAYNLAHTPCHDVVRTGPLCLPSGAREVYPLDHWLAEVGIEGYIGIPLIASAGRVLGLVSALSRRPLRRPESALHQMMVWAARATAELERLGAEEAVRASEERFRQLFEHSPDAIFVEDLQGNVLDVNPAACRLHDRQRSDLVGRNITDLVPPSLRDQARRDFARLVAGDIDHIDGYSWVRTGEALPVAIRASRLEYFGKQAVLLHVRDVSAQRAAEEALRESEAQFRMVLQQLPSMVWTVNTQQRITLALGRPMARMGRTPENTVGLTLAEYFHGRSDAGQLLDYHRRALAGESLQYETQVCGIAFECRLQPLYNQRGEIVGCLGASLDVTERVRATAAVRESETRFRAIFDSSPECAKLLARDGTLLEINQAGLAMIEADSADQVVGQCVYPLLVEKQRSDFQRLVEQIFDGRSGVLEFEIVGLKGGRRWMETHATPLVDAAGRVVAALSVTRDVTERRRLEQAIRESEERFRQFAEHLPFMVCMLTPDVRQLLYVNRAAETIFGRSRESLTSPASWLALIYEEDRPRIAHSIQMPFDRNPRTSEFRIVRPDGSIRWLRSLAVPLVNAQGEFYLLTVLIEDVTEQKLAAERLARKQAELLHVSRLSTIGHMVATMSHEISQPLAAVGNYSAACASLLEESSAPEPKQFRHYVGEIARQTQRAGAILRRLRAFGARSTPDREPYQLNWLLHDAAELVASELRRQGVALHWELAEPSPQILVDRIQFQQVIVNLLTNACDALQSVEPARRQAAIRSHVNDDTAVIEIIDSGPGLPPDVLSSLFEPFFTTKPDGMGLGLSICREIIEDHGGHIEGANSPQGGAIFRLQLPLEAEEPPSPVLVRLPELQVE